MFQKVPVYGFPISPLTGAGCLILWWSFFYIIVDHDSWLLVFYLAISRGGIPPRLVLSGGYAASLMYFVWLPSCGDVPQEEGLFFCKAYVLVNVSLSPVRLVGFLACCEEETCCGDHDDTTSNGEEGGTHATGGWKGR